MYKQFVYFFSWNCQARRTYKNHFTLDFIYVKSYKYYFSIKISNFPYSLLIRFRTISFYLIYIFLSNHCYLLHFISL